MTIWCISLFDNCVFLLHIFQDFLHNLNPSVSVDDDKIIRWHPKFHVDDVPDVDEAALPQPPVVKTYNSAHDVLKKACNMMAPRVCTASAFVKAFDLEKAEN